jgi:type I restriction enzyme, S subunit
MTSAGWPSLPLKRIVDSVQSGTSVNGAPWPAQDDHLGVLKTSAVYGGVFTPAENKEVESYDLDRVSCPVLAGSLIVNRANTQQHLGVAAAVHQDFPNLYLPDKLWAVTFNDAEPRFIDWWTKTAAYRAQVEAVCVGTSSSMQNISQADFLEIRIELPDLETQRAIADYLDRETARIDMLIEGQQRLVVLLAERRVGVIAEPFNQAHPTVPLGSALEELIDHRGKTPGKVGNKTDDFTDEGVPVVSAIHIKNGQVSWGERERFVPYWMFEKWMPVRLRTGDVLLTSEAPLGSVAQVPSDAPLVLSQRLFALRGREDILDSTYLRFFLESDRGQALLRDGSSGSTVSGIRQSRLVQVPVPIPPLDEQREVSKKISEQIVKIDTLVDETERFIELARERRAALITAAVTGQIDVREMA